MAIMEKQPRQWAVEIMRADTAERKRELFSDVPEHFRELVRAHCNTIAERKRRAQSRPPRKWAQRDEL